jgi:lysophospholipase L1-like esterase
VIASPKRHNKHTFIFLTFLVSLGLILGLGEIGARLFVDTSGLSPDVYRQQSLQYEPALFARHIFQAKAHSARNAFGNKKGLQWEMNEKGYRGPNFEENKPEQTIRIIVYGGSAVFDTRTDRNADWPRLVEKNLREAGFAHVEVINAGIPGHTAVESVGRLFTEGFRFSPDYVLLYNAWNDIKYFTAPQSFLRTVKPLLHQFDYRIHNVNSLDQWLCNSSHLYNILRRLYFKKKMKIGQEGLIASQDRSPATALYPLQFRQYQLAVELFVDLARNIGAQPILVTQARLVHPDNTEEQRKRIDYHHVGLTHDALLETFSLQDAIIKDVASKKKIPVFDASRKFADKDWAFYDHVHFLPEGSEAMAQFISSKMEEVLANPSE